MYDEITLQRRAREAIRAGRVPHEQPVRTWGGPGSGTDCSVCEELLGDDQIELELEFAPQGRLAEAKSVLMHTSCYDAWLNERKHLAPVLSCSPAPGTMHGRESEAQRGRKTG